MHFYSLLSWLYTVSSITAKKNMPSYRKSWDPEITWSIPKKHAWVMVTHRHKYRWPALIRGIHFQIGRSVAEFNWIWLFDLQRKIHQVYLVDFREVKRSSVVKLAFPASLGKVSCSDWVESFQGRPTCSFQSTEPWTLHTLQHKVLSLVYSKCIIIECAAVSNCTNFHTTHPWVPSNTPAKCEVNQMNGSRDMLRTCCTHTHTFVAL